MIVTLIKNLIKLPNKNQRNFGTIKSGTPLSYEA
jgi:hypothetical protein